MSTLDIYLISLIPALGNLFVVVSVVLMVASATSWAASIFDDSKDFREASKKVRKPLTIAFIITCVLGVGLPDKQTMIAMYVVPPVLKTLNDADIPKDLMKFIKHYLKTESEEGN